ncbi:hypothetical protein CYR55_22885 [Chimaeribacter californicus]|uniref:Nucleotide-diphospho-sugar transferase domain-containing protein n=1 Tax=Chimaeribacter californicus TaxID=2060067 RepID=A0A2N5DSS5_9GAMM|nr:hypothetical protein [Chimaeribacter californicus]PLR29255.1 hypothetical protein CYR55_22885 [Chimaeribacter californicus]
MQSSKPVVVSFFTPEWEYASRAAALIRRCDELGLAHDIQPRESRGNWNKNTAMKAEFIREMLAKHEHIIWMDCDGELRQLPVLCIEHEDPRQVLAVPHQTMPRNWHVCVLSFRRSLFSTLLVERWVDVVRNQDVTDELAFHWVSGICPKRFTPLPTSYCALPQKGQFQADAVWCLGVSTARDKMAMKARQAAKK